MLYLSNRNGWKFPEKVEAIRADGCIDYFQLRKEVTQASRGFLIFWASAVGVAVIYDGGGD